MFGVIGSLAALTEARSTGRGQEVDVAIYEAVAALMESSMADLELGGVLRGRSGSTLTGVAPSNVYPTADGAEVVIAGNADSVFARLCQAMGRPELATDERYSTHGARGVNMAELDDLIGAWTATLPAAALLERLEAHGVPAGQIFTAREMLSDPQYLARKMVQRHLSYQGWEVPMTGIVPRFTRTPGAVRHTGQPLGHDTDAVLREVAGCTDDELDELAKARLI
jgi:formyl-CoA transferase/succinyl-CoA--D-citramalate CoA-transferase